MTATEGDRSRELRRRPLVRVGVALAVAAAAGLAVWLLTRSTVEESARPVEPSSGGVTLADLRALSKRLGQPIYWLGPRSEGTLELIRSGSRRIYLRYLPPGVEAGEAGPVLTIATYPLRNAFALHDGPQPKGMVKLRAPGGGIALYKTASPTNVYLAYPDSDYQIEVYAPGRGVARRLVQSGAVQVIGGPVTSLRTNAVAVTPDRLRALAASLGRPIYWAGTRPNTTYELTRTKGGRVHVRYLPEGAPVGSPNLYLTVSTYPLKNAFRATLAAASGKGTVTIPLSGGAIGVFSRKHPLNVYVAYPGSSVQVEVFDPKPSRARKLVASETISPVR